MKKKLILPLAFILMLSSCTHDTEDIDVQDFDLQENKSTKSKIEDDSNFKELVSNYASLIDKAYKNVQNTALDPKTINEEDVLSLLEFKDNNAFTEYQFKQQTYYSKLIEDYNIKSKEEIKELSDKITKGTDDTLEASYQSNWGVCEINFLYCLVGVLAQYQDYLSANTGIGCSWTAGSDCMNDLAEYQAFSLWVMGTCISDYSGC